MFAHEASYDCTFCGTHFCYGECRNDGTDIVYGGDKRNLEVVPTVPATSESSGGFRTGSDSERRAVRTLPEVSSGLPFTSKTYSRSCMAYRHRLASKEFDTVRAMEYF